MRVPALATVIVLALAGCAGTQANKTGPGAGDTRFVAGSGAAEEFKAADRKKAPQVKGETLDGKPYTLPSGKVAVINFWASWCAPCIAEAPVLKQVHEETKDQGVEFLGVDFKDGRENAKAFERNHKVAYPSLYDQPGEIALSFHGAVSPNAIPTTLVLDRQGRIAARFIGEVRYTALSQVVRKVAAEKP
ncbi:TlpA family protein disulfide reductase [Bailinhaonella thermotolerans]|uniref:TlpA family protein disulfide reductase n=2 Tax=Bailinhaonella thermotolerans TaxID=1070861 RepID=A0A3A4A974_9ACTN|nr:TlpA family protein disulfide reductase [Bailinhaonella thermotolerans]